MKKKRCRPAFPPPVSSGLLQVRLHPSHVALFRFLLEAYDNLALFSVLDRRQALLKVMFSPHQELEVRRMLSTFSDAIPFEILPWPCRGGSRE